MSRVRTSTKGRPSEQTKVGDKVVEKLIKSPLKGNVLRVLTPKRVSGGRTAIAFELPRDYTELLRDTLGFKKVAKLAGVTSDQEEPLPATTYVKDEVLYIQLCRATEENRVAMDSRFYNFMVVGVSPITREKLKEMFPVEFEHELRFDVPECSRELVPIRRPEFIMLGFDLKSAKIVGKVQNDLDEWFMS